MFTKGEWKAYKGRCHYTIENGRPYSTNIIAKVPYSEANANLIAKSPRMAELLQRLVNNGWSASISIEAKEIIESLDLS